MSDELRDAPIDDGSKKPNGFVSPDGELEVRDSVDLTGQPFHGYHETELGAHMRHMRQAPDLLQKYEDLLIRFQLQAAQHDGEKKAWSHERQQLFDDLQEALSIVMEMSLLTDCDEEKSKCVIDSGPYCQAHGDNYLHREVVGRSRQLIQLCQSRYVRNPDEAMRQDSK